MLPEVLMYSSSVGTDDLLANAVHFAPWYRNQMTVQVAEELKPLLTREKTGLDVAAEYVKSETVEEGYLDRPYGNAYDFDQVDKVVGVFGEV